MSRFVAFFALFLLAATVSFGQAVAIGSISGEVEDQSGSAVPGATVLVTEANKGTVHKVTANGSGHYTAPNLPVGPYRLEVQATGFKSFVQTGIVLQVAQNVTLNVVLQVGTLTETVEVQAAGSMVETKDTSISQVISQQPIVDLPLNGRNPADLLTLSGLAVSSNVTGMTLNGGDLTGSKNIQGSNGSGQYSVAGSAANGVNFLLDGGDNNDAFSNVNLPIPFPDALQEFSVQTEGLSAQYGLHPGGVVNIVTKSGTNSLHGDLFDFLRNGDLNARQEGTLKRDTLKRNQFGGTVGGRIIRDKLFFFGGYQGTRQRSDPATNNAWVPTQAALNGDFSVLDSTSCLKSARQLKDPSGAPYAGNRIPVSSFDAAGSKLASSFLPLASDPCGKVQFGYPSNNPDDQWIGRVDYNLSDKQVLYFRYYLYDFLAQSVFDGHNALTTGQPGNQDRSQTATISHTYTLSSSTVNSFHGTFDRRRDNRASTLFSPVDLGVNMFVNTPDYTQLTVSGYSGGGFNIGCGTCAKANFDINTYQIADDFLLVRGRHEFAIGFDGRKDQFNSYNYQQANGQFTFNGQTTGDGLADLLVGRFSGLTDGRVISDYLRQTVIAAYVQDSFKVTPRFSMNFGVRWEPSVPAYDKYGRGNQFSWNLFNQGWHSSCQPGAPAGLIFSCDSAQDPYGKAFTAAHWATFSPRFGVVLDPRGDGKQTLRASFALLHDTTELFYPERWTTNAPYVSSITLTSGLLSDPFANYTLNGVTGDPFPGSGAAIFPNQGQYISVPPNLHVTYMMQWNLSYQRQVKDWLVTANYLGNATRHIWGSIDVNQAIPLPGATTSNTNKRRPTYLSNPTAGAAYGEIQVTDDGANAAYHALALRAEHRMSKHFQVLVNYTWSHCTSTWDFAGELAGPVYQNSFGGSNGEGGNCGFDHRQIFNGSVVADSPGIGSGVSRLITKNWQISPIVGFFTGNPIQITDGKDNSLSGQNLDRPNVIAPSQVYPSQRSAQEEFNPAAFAFAPAGTFGNLGRNAVYGPGRINWDMAVSRLFPLSERWRFEIRGDFFNLMNHGNPGNAGGGSFLGTSLSSSGTLGQVTSFMPPRIIQLAMKVYF